MGHLLTRKRGEGLRISGRDRWPKNYPAVSGRDVGDNDGVESVLLEHLVAAGGPAAQSCLRWVVLGESLPADPGCLDVIWPDWPMTL
jgi:hypothetical protein